MLLKDRTWREMIIEREKARYLWFMVVFNL
jgi:hypothetical protein